MQRFSTVLFVSAAIVQSAMAQERAPQREPAQRRVPLRQVFTVPGVEFSKDQQAQVAAIRETYAPQLAEIVRARNDVYTRDQRQAMREALGKARESGQNARQARQAAEAAVKLTGDQTQRLEDLEQQQRQLTAKIRAELTALLTAEQRQALQGAARQQGRRPTHANVKYGEHERHVMDVWLVESDKPTPVLVSIHGGGFRGGNKSVDGGLLDACLNSGISVVAITYRLSQHAIAPAQFHDSARAIQFIRSNAQEWNLDPKRMAATGGSAGAGISLWLGFHDDLAQPESEDPIARQSSRLSCMVVYNGQTSYDPRVIRALFPENDTYKHPALAQLYDVDLDKLDDLPQEKYALFEKVSSMPHLTQDDPPVLLFYASEMDTPIRSQGVGIHHPRFGKVLKEKMDPLGIECTVRTGVRRGSDEWVQETLAFVWKHFEQQ